MKPVPWTTRPLPTLWLNARTGTGVDNAGRPITPVIRGRRQNPNLEDILNTAQVEGIKRIILIGPIPERDRHGRHWFESDLDDWRHGQHWLSGGPPVGRYFHKTQPRGEKGEKPYEVSLVSAWFGSANLSPQQAREAWELTERVVVREDDSMQGLMKSPAGTGQQMWAQSLPPKADFPLVADDIAEELHLNSGQHHIEHLVEGPGFIEHEFCRPLMRRERGEKMPGFAYVDGRFMYAACGGNLGVGPATRMRAQESAELWFAEDNGRRVGQFQPAYYSVRVRVPEGWNTLGIMPLKHTTPDGQRVWVWPNIPGAEFDTWAGNEELRLAEECGWQFRFHEGISFQNKKPAEREKGKLTEARPLDTFCKRITTARERVEALAQENGIDPVIAKAASGALRAILLQTIGSFASRGRAMTVYVDSTWDVPPEYEHTMQVRGDQISYQAMNPMSEKQRAYYRPELAVQVWSRARARVLHGPMAGGQKRGALDLDPETLIGVQGDALYTTSLPEWSLPTERGGLDDGKPGRLRLKGFLDHPDAPVPTTVAARLRLARSAEAAGLSMIAGE